ncbi:hypothetical protein P43SY_003934 [Pythium insidiosum]|uniref:Uncharacterized protein n=1 Tax=Pythium insidiosum TaxID=114742 RepID=A0AAD5QA47_PYTIN|nr:hypothetical protein P43SY_003934 [Pythium insidiosum]
MAMQQLVATGAAAPTASTSTHFVGDKVKSLCFLKDANDEASNELLPLPLLATGGWDDGQSNAVSVLLPVVATADELALRLERGSPTRPVELRAVARAPHDGDVNALRFVSSSNQNLLFSASSTGAVTAFQVASAADTQTQALAISRVGAESLPPLAFRDAATCLDVCVTTSAGDATVVAASAGGDLAWLRLQGAGAAASVVTSLENKDSSRLPIHAVKVLTPPRDSVVATVGAAPGGQLRLWDATANQRYPVLTASAPPKTAALTSLETHPTRPELLITGGDDGSVAFWDQRRLDAPFRVDAHHDRAVRALLLHRTSPRLLFSASDDASVRCWHFEPSTRSAVEYDRHTAVHVAPVAQSFLPWNALDLHAASDSLIAGSDAQSLLLVRHASRLRV